MRTISGIMTFFSIFFAGPPVSFYLAQCATPSAPAENLAKTTRKNQNQIKHRMIPRLCQSNFYSLTI